MASTRSDADLYADGLETGSGAPTAPERTLERAIGAQIREYRQRVRLSLADVCAAEGRPITGFEHVDWQPADELAGPYAVW